MFEDWVIEKLVTEIMSRLTMMEDINEYEIDMVRPKYLLDIQGGGGHSEFTLTPVALDPSGERYTAIAVRFVTMKTGVFKKDDPAVGLFDWLRTNPWLSIQRPESE
jgi:hypothetical protein